MAALLTLKRTGSPSRDISRKKHKIQARGEQGFESKSISNLYDDYDRSNHSTSPGASPVMLRAADYGSENMVSASLFGSNPMTSLSLYSDGASSSSAGKKSPVSKPKFRTSQDLRETIMAKEEEYKRKSIKVSLETEKIRVLDQEIDYIKNLLKAHIDDTPFKELKSAIEKHQHPLEERHKKSSTYVNTKVQELNSLKKDIEDMKNLTPAMQQQTFNTSGALYAPGALYGSAAGGASLTPVASARPKGPDPRMQRDRDKSKAPVSPQKQLLVPEPPLSDALFRWHQRALPAPVVYTLRMVSREEPNHVKREWNVRPLSPPPQAGNNSGANGSASAAHKQRPWYVILSFLTPVEIGNLDVTSWRKVQGPEIANLDGNENRALSPSGYKNSTHYQFNHLWSPLLPILNNCVDGFPFTRLQVTSLSHLKWLWHRAPLIKHIQFSKYIVRDLCQDMTIPSDMQDWFVFYLRPSDLEFSFEVRDVRGEVREFCSSVISESMFNYCARIGNSRMLDALLKRADMLSGQDKDILEVALVHNVFRFQVNNCTDTFGLPKKIGLFCNFLGFTPLHFAAVEGNTEAVKVILKYLQYIKRNGNIPTDIRDFFGGEGESDNHLSPFHGWTPLHLAALAGNAKVVDLLLEGNKENSGVKTGARDKIYGQDWISDEYTPLHCAVLGSSTKESREYVYNTGCLGAAKSLIKAMCEADVNINVPDNTSNTAMHYATSCNNLTMIKLIVAESAPVYCREKPKLDIKNRGGDSAMHIACEEGFLDIVQYLHPSKPLEKEPESVQRAREHIPYSNLSERNENGDTPLHVAIQNEHVEIVDHLSNLGTDKQKAKHATRFDQKNKTKMTPLALAVALLKDDKYNPAFIKIKKIIDQAMQTKGVG